jgi:integrase
LTFEGLQEAYKRGRKVLARRQPGYLAQLDDLGAERALIYRVLLQTGLRKGELASITLGHLRLDANPPHLILDAAAEKNRQGATFPLQQGLVRGLLQFLRSRAAKTDGHMDISSVLFRIPRDLSRILDRDLQAAGIRKRDDRGWVVDVHALRHTFGTQLSRAGVPLRTAQAAMRHSSPELTANVYTDPRLLDVAGAIQSLPSFEPPDNVEQTAVNVAAS